MSNQEIITAHYECELLQETRHPSPNHGVLVVIPEAADILARGIVDAHAAWHEGNDTLFQRAHGRLPTCTITITRPDGQDQLTVRS